MIKGRILSINGVPVKGGMYLNISDMKNQIEQLCHIGRCDNHAVEGVEFICGNDRSVYYFCDQHCQEVKRVLSFLHRNGLGTLTTLGE